MLLATTWLSTSASAQTEPAPGTADVEQPAKAKPADADTTTTDTGRIADIVVTAQRRTESLQRVPISAQVLSQQTLIQQNLTSVVAISEVAPSIHVFGSGRSSNFYIRGTGSGESQSFDQSVGTFIDDIYHGRSRLSAATFVDLDHLEVLKGPQTTFFGNNAIAGAFNIVTRKPSQQFEGWARALISPQGGSNSGQFALEGAVNVPLTDDLAVRVAGTYNGQRGYLLNIVTGNKVPQQDNYAFRGTLRFAPTDALEVTLKGEVGRSLNKGGLVLRNTECPPQSPFVAAGFCGVNVRQFDALPTLRSNEYVASDGNQSRLNTGEGVLTANYRLDGGGTITSVTGYNGYKFRLDLDDDATAQDLLNVQAPERYNQFSQELRYASAAGRPVEFLAGLYFQADRLRIQQSISYFFLTPNLSVPAGLAPLRPYLPLGQVVNASQREHIYSAFASVTFNLGENLKLNAGLRGSITDKDFDWNLFFGTAAQRFGGVVPFPVAVAPIASALGLGTAGSVSLNRSDKALMPSARVQYQAGRDVMVYASYNRGFKAGGFSVAELSAVPSNYLFDPEHVNAYEVGLKSEFANKRILLNVAAFRNDFSDLQVVIQGTSPTGALINFIRNAAASRAQGIELETQFVVSPAFRLKLEGTYLDSTYRNYRNAGPTYDQQLAGQTVQDLSGHRTLFAPRWSGNVTGTFTVPLGDYRMTAEALGIFSSRYQTYSTDDRLTEQGGYGRLDARLSIDSPGSRWGFDIVAKNLTNHVIRTFSGYQPTSRGSLFQDREQLRNVAVQARLKF